MKESLLFTRRDFLRASTVLAVGAAMPSFLLKTAEAALAAVSGNIPGFADDHILVVVQLAGGNDGLNMVAPVGDDAYAKARPKLGLKANKVLALGDGLRGLNPRMKGMKELFDSGKLAIVEGVGYPNPNRSHFRSTEIWQTAVDSDKQSPTGWIGRYLDAQCSGEGQPTAALALGAGYEFAYVDGAGPNDGYLELKLPAGAMGPNMKGKSDRFAGMVKFDGALCVAGTVPPASTTWISDVASAVCTTGLPAKAGNTRV